MAFYEIPLGPSQRTMTIGLGAKTYGLRFSYADADEAGWFLDISDLAGNPLLCGLPLVTGVDLLAPYTDLAFGGSLYVVSDGANSGAVPAFTDLGVTSHVIWEPTA